MGRITEPELQVLAEAWSPVVLEMLDEVGQRVWPPRKERQGLFGKPVIITRYSLEGPAHRSGKLLWALSHTSQPSTFDEHGTLSEGEREFWLVALQPGNPPLFSVEGTRLHECIPVDREALLKALNDSRKEGPKAECFYGNKGPLSHR